MGVSHTQRARGRNTAAPLSTHTRTPNLEKGRLSCLTRGFLVRQKHIGIFFFLRAPGASAGADSEDRGWGKGEKTKESAGTKTQQRKAGGTELRVIRFARIARSCHGERCRCLPWPRGPRRARGRPTEGSPALRGRRGRAGRIARRHAPLARP